MGGTKFWFCGFRNCLITVAERELLLLRPLAKQLVNHARPSDVTGGYAADWSIGQLREPAQTSPTGSKLCWRLGLNLRAQPRGGR